MTLKQRLFFSMLFLLVFAAVAALIANGVAIHYYKPDMLFPYVFVLLIVTAASAANLLRAFQRSRLQPLRVPIRGECRVSWVPRCASDAEAEQLR